MDPMGLTFLFSHISSKKHKAALSTQDLWGEGNEVDDLHGDHWEQKGSEQV